MKIALLAPIWNQITKSPKLYGILAVVRDLALGLKERGHKVTLFCAARSKVNVGTLPSLEFSLVDKKIPMLSSESVFYSFLAAARALKCAEGKFDIIHSHMDFFPLPFAPFLKTPMVTTIHGAWFSQGAKEIFNTYKGEPFVSLSDATRKNLPGLNYVATIYNGIDLSQFNFSALKTKKTELPPTLRGRGRHFSERKGDYLLFLGRFVPDKGADLAIKVAKKAKVPLILAGAEAGKDKDYFSQKILPQVDGKMIKFVGGVFGEKKADLLKNALALLFPVRWQEPFGLVMIEAMACGTPVIAFNRGSVPEMVRDSMTGFVIKTDNRQQTTDNLIIKKAGAEGMMEAVREIKKLDMTPSKMARFQTSSEMTKLREMRRNCRAHIEKNFTIEKMVKSYEKVYQKVLGSRC